MAIEEMRDLVQRFMLEHFERPEATCEACTPDVTIHWAWGTETRGADAVVALLQQDPESDWIWPPRTVVDDCFAGEDRVAMRFRVLFTLKATN